MASRSAPLNDTWRCPDCDQQVARHLATCPHCRENRTAGPASQPLLVVSTDTLPGWTVLDVYGLVTGCTVRSRNAFSDLGSDLKSIVGGELGGATKMVLDARRDAQQRMEVRARAFGANAVIGVRFENDTLGSGSSQSSAFVAYGTAVLVERNGVRVEHQVTDNGS